MTFLTFPFFDRFTVEQIRAQYARCAASQRKAGARAVKTGKKVSGRTAEQWAAMASEYETLAQTFTR